MWVAGIDFDSHGIDLVLLNEDDNCALHHHWELDGWDAFSRARDVPSHRSLFESTAWRNVIALGIEDPRGPARSADAPIYRVQGAILAYLSPTLLIECWKPQSWRKALGIPHIGKGPVADYALEHWTNAPEKPSQDALDAFCIAAATRKVLVRTAVSA